MEELKTRLKEITDDVQGLLNRGYNIDDLLPMHRADLDGFIFAIYEMENAFDNLDFFFGESVEDKLKQEFAEKVFEEVYRHMIGTASLLVYSYEDGEEYTEDGESE